jgi:hypothetical protein
MRCWGTSDNIRLRLDFALQGFLTPSTARNEILLAPPLIVVMVVPITFFMPTVFVFFPPLMPLAPAPLPCPAQLTTLVIGLSAVTSMSCDCLMKFMLRVSDPALTQVQFFSLKTRYEGANQNRCEN